MTTKKPLSGWNVLVVDDEMDSRTVATMMLQNAGAHVWGAEHGRAALERLAEGKRPDFILTDLSMPEMDGWSLMHELNKNRVTMDIPVIALTAHAMNGDRERAISAGFRNYITKPLSFDKFISQLLAILVDQPEFAAAFAVKG